MTFRERDWGRSYKSTKDSNALLNSFFLPALKESVVYLRGAGFFSSSMFDTIGKELGDFIERGGRMRILASVHISQKDSEAIELGLKKQSEVTEEELARIIEEDFRPPLKPGSMMLTRLLEMGRLEIKIGVKNPGMYHEKIGIFFDKDVDLNSSFEDLVSQDHLTFFGSVNEGVTAWQHSHENIKVFPSWMEHRAADANDTLQDFMENWGGKTAGLEVVDFPDAMRKKLLRIREDTRAGDYDQGEQEDSVEREDKTDFSHFDTRNVWIEKTKVAGREDREVGERSLGRAIWSPRKNAQGADIYAEMREVSKGDLVIHLVNDTSKDTYISGVSVVKNESVIRTDGISGTNWEGPAYLHELEDYIKLKSPLYRPHILSEENRGVMDQIRQDSKVFYTANMQLRQGHYLTPCPPKLTDLINNICLEINGTPLPHLGSPIASESPNDIGVEQEESSDPRYDFQDEAVEWFCNGKANGVGIFEMATGSGKTWTSMKCIRRLFEDKRIDKVVIAVPNSIMSQWRMELRDFLKMKKDGGVITTLFEYSGEKKDHFKFRNARSGSFLLVSHSMLLDLLKIAKSWDLGRTIFVADEMHHVGSNRFTKEEKREVLGEGEEEREQVALEREEGSLSKFGFKLGLSATPWSTYDDDADTRNRFLVRQFTRFGEIEKGFFKSDWRKQLHDEDFVFYFGLDSGITSGILAEFDYEPLEYEPTAAEKAKYAEMVRKSFGSDDDGQPNILGAIRAAAVFKSSKEKIPVFFDWLKNKDLDRTLIFVADTNFGRILMKELNSRGRSNFSSYFQGDPEESLDAFARGETHFLVSCHRISEGVNIKTVGQIILFSSSAAELETIQRIGRALRITGDKKKRATVVDFIYDNSNSTTNPDVTRREWLLGLSESRNP